MKWNEIREAFPHQWLIIEAIESHNENNFRIYDCISVVEILPHLGDEEGSAVFEAYNQIRLKHPMRELIFVHTSHEELVVQIVRNHTRFASKP